MDQVHTPDTHTTHRLADALLSRTQQRVLGLLFDQPERSFFASELINLAACGTGTVQRELVRLTDCGLVSIRKQRKQKFYQANPQAPLYTPLRQLVAALKSPVTRMHEALQPLREHLQYVSVTETTNTEHASGVEWHLLVVAESLRLADLFSALKPVEAVLETRLEISLYTPADFAQLRARNNPRLLALINASSTVLLGTIDNS